ncbi:MAG: hypothetical protein IKN60_01675 [Bacteroidales bacterium]|nr:hypothetical protein [Bacteroidales bacterium]
MSIFLKQTDPLAEHRVDSPEAMYRAIRACGIIPFFENPVAGYSIEEMTPAEHWFDGESLGPWDWKIFAVQCGDVAYGKFLWGGKASFATAEVYRDLLNWRRSLPKYALREGDRRAYEAICEAGSLTSRELRRICGLKKAQMDAIMTRLQNQTLVVTGDFERVYKGEFLEYSGWQLSSFCRPEDLFEYDLRAPFRTPQESRGRLAGVVRAAAPHVTDAQLHKMLD